MRANISDRDYEILSAYMDGQLSSGERSRLEERLRARPDLRTALEDMQKMRALLRQAPRRRAPRNFTLTPAMVGERKPRTSPWAGLFPVLSFTSAVAALALVVVIALQIGPQPTQQSVAMQQPEITAELPAAEAAEQAAPAEQEAPSEQEAPAEPGAGGAPAAKAPGSPAATEPVDTFAAPELQAVPTEPAGQEDPAVTMEAAVPEEAAAMPAAPAPTPTPSPESSTMAAAEPAATLPPVINWNGVPGIVGEAGGMGGMGGGPGDIMMGPGMGVPDGRGGGPTGGGVDGPPGGVYLPPESVVESGEEQPAPAPTLAPTPSGDSGITGTGPILGVPSAEEGGQIINREALSRGDVTPTPAAVAAAEEQPAAEELPAAEQPAAEEPAAEQPAAEEAQPAEPPVAEAPAAEPAQEGARALDTAPQAGDQAGNASAQEPASTVLGMNRQLLLGIEILLGLVALAAGGAAFYLRRRARR